jgi:hypothetical protein
MSLLCLAYSSNASLLHNSRCKANTNLALNHTTTRGSTKATKELATRATKLLTKEKLATKHASELRLPNNNTSTKYEMCVHPNPLNQTWKSEKM